VTTPVHSASASDEATDSRSSTGPAARLGDACTLTGRLPAGAGPAFSSQ
jgi:hypothetical protein